MNKIEKYINYRSKNRYLLTFISTMILGLLAHSFMFYNKISFHDDVSSIEGFSATALFASGRYTQGIIKIINDFLFGTYSNSFLNGIISLAILSLVNLMIVKLLDINKIVNIIITSSCIVLSMGYLCLNAFIYTSVFYCISIFLSVLSTYIFFNYTKKNDLLKIILIAILLFASMTIYQSYFLFGLVIFLYKVFLDAYNNDIDIKKVIQYIIAILLSFLLLKIANSLFFLTFNSLNNKFNLNYSSLQLASYQGISDTTIANTLMINNIINVLKHIFIRDEILFGNNYQIYLLFLLFIIFSLISLIAKKSAKQNIFMIFSLLSIILCINSLYMLSEKTHIYALPLFPKCLIFLFPIIFIEHIINRKTITFFIYIIFIYQIMYNIAICNTTYLNRLIRQNNDISFCQTLATRIQSLDGYDDDYDIYVYGKKSGYDVNKSDKKFDDYNQIFDSIPIYNVSSINGYNFMRYMELWTGFKSRNFKFNVDVGNKEIVKEMKCYPDDGSIKLVDDKIIIKFSEIDE